MNAYAYALHAAQQQKRHFVKWDAFWMNQWDILPGEHRLYLGANRACYDECCHRQLCDLSLAPFPVLSIVGPYLRAIQKGHKDDERRLDHPGLLERRPPLYFDEMYRSPYLAYVDLEAAYWSIYTRASLDIFYDGEHAPRAGEIKFLDAERLREIKLVRNGMLGMLRRESRRGIDHGEPFREMVPPWRRRPDLWGLVMDTLEMIMWSARDHGAVYVHTDGAIFCHPDLAEDWIAFVYDRWNLTASIRVQGEGAVYGMGRFRIGQESHGPEIPGNRVDSMLRAPKSLQKSLDEWLTSANLLPLETSSP